MENHDSMSKINTIIFDLGGVLINWDPKRLFRKVFDTEEKVEWFLTNICTMDWNEAQDAGRPIAEATTILVDKYPEYKKEIEAYYGRWTEMLDGAKSGTVEILKTFHEDPNYEIFALTNWSAETFPFAQERFEFLKWFKGILVSGEEGIRKPSKEIYELILSRYDIDPTKSIFIDDSERNVKAAIEAGIPSIVFTNADDLKRDLQALQVLD